PAEHLDLAAGGVDQAEQHADQRGLARTVRPEQAVPVALAHLEADRAHGGNAAVALGQPAGPDHVRAGHARVRPHRVRHDSVTSSARSVAACSSRSVLTVPAIRKVTKNPAGRKMIALTSGAPITTPGPLATESGVPPAEIASGIRLRPSEPRTPRTTNVLSPPP